MKKYEEAVLEIRDIIKGGAAGDVLPSVRELMQTLDMSQVSVVRALKELKREGVICTRVGEGTFISDAQEASSRTRNILMLVTDYPSSFSIKFQTTFQQYFEGIEEYQLKTVLYDYKATDIRAEINCDAYDAVIVYPDVNLDVSSLAALSASGVPVIVIQAEINCLGIDTVCMDNEYGGSLVAEWFIQNGHKRVAMLLAQPHNHTCEDRLRGLRNHYRLKGLDEPVVIDCNTASGENSIAKAYEAFKALIEQGNNLDFSAIFCDSDLGAMGVYKACNERGLALPDSLSIIGYGNVAECEFYHPSLSSVDQDVAAWASTAHDILVRRFTSRDTGNFREHVTPKLVIRDSCISV